VSSEQVNKEEGDEGEKKDERRLDGAAKRYAPTGNNGSGSGTGTGSGGRVPRKEATTASEPNANLTSPVQRREQVAGVRACVGMRMGMGTAGSNGCKAPGLGPNLLHRTASGGMVVHGKTQSINQQAGPSTAFRE
jgi:hypothetical protein